MQMHFIQTLYVEIPFKNKHTHTHTEHQSEEAP